MWLRRLWGIKGKPHPCFRPYFYHPQDSHKRQCWLHKFSWPRGPQCRSPLPAKSDSSCIQHNPLPRFKTDLKTPAATLIQSQGKTPAALHLLCRMQSAGLCGCTRREHLLCVQECLQLGRTHIHSSCVCTRSSATALHHKHKLLLKCSAWLSSLPPLQHSSSSETSRLLG